MNSSNNTRHQIKQYNDIITHHTSQRPHGCSPNSISLAIIPASPLISPLVFHKLRLLQAAFSRRAVIIASSATTSGTRNLIRYWGLAWPGPWATHPHTHMYILPRKMYVRACIETRKRRPPTNYIGWVIVRQYVLWKHVTIKQCLL